MSFWTPVENPGTRPPRSRAFDVGCALLAALSVVRELSFLSDRGNLARFTGEAGDPAGARDQLAVLLPVMGGVLGPNHPYALAAQSNLAQWTHATDPTRTS